jgi:hypothetical protein
VRADVASWRKTELAYAGISLFYLRRRRWAWYFTVARHRHSISPQAGRQSLNVLLGGNMYSSVPSFLVTAIAAIPECVCVISLTVVIIVCPFLWYQLSCDQEPVV